MNLTPEKLNLARKRLLRMHFESGVGHIGGNLSAIDALMLVFHDHIVEGDHFVLSKGHAAGALYTTLWSLNRLSDEDLTTFHRDGTLLPGHPPTAGNADIRFATGSLGHGLSLAAGTALALRLRGKQGHVFCMTSDGEWQEGSTWEALIFACHHRLANLTVLVDHNGLQGFGSTQGVASMDPLWEKLAGFAVRLQRVPGHDLEQMHIALREKPLNRPRIFILETSKGRGVGFMEGQMEWHYLPMSPEQYAQAIADMDSR